MTQLIYDGSFEGLLTAVFEVYDRKLSHSRITRHDKVRALGLFDHLDVSTDQKKAARVLKGLRSKVSAGMLKDLYWCFLSELEGIETRILEFVQYVFSSKENIEGNYGHPAVIELAQVSRKVGREKHRFEAFVRFQLVQDTFFYAAIDPDYNVLPLIVPHFKRRYADQDWLIYDTKRRYGVHYNKETEEVCEALIDFKPESHAGKATNIAFDADEAHYQSLWKHYFKHVNIVARKNMKLHLQHVPKRYWKYLVEKQPA